MNPQEAVLTLIKADWSEARIGQTVGISQSTINRVKQGKRSVKYEQGAALISLAREIGAGSTASESATGMGSATG